MNPKSGAIEAIYGGEDATKHFTNNADADRCPGRLDVQAVRAGGRHVGTVYATPRVARVQAQDERTVGLPEEPLQRQEQAEDQELRRHRLDGQGRQGVAPDERRR